MSKKTEKLSDKPWDKLTPKEKRRWEDAANDSDFRLNGRQLHQDATAQWHRQLRQKQSF